MTVKTRRGPNTVTGETARGATEDARARWKQTTGNNTKKSSVDVPPRQCTQKSSVVVSEAGVSRMCSGRGSFHRKIQVKSSQEPAPALPRSGRELGTRWDHTRDSDRTGHHRSAQEFSPSEASSAVCSSARALTPRVQLYVCCVVCVWGGVSGCGALVPPSPASARHSHTALATASRPASFDAAQL
jgi:hypothetical protein